MSCSSGPLCTLTLHKYVTGETPLKLALVADEVFGKGDGLGACTGNERLLVLNPTHIVNTACWAISE